MGHGVHKWSKPLVCTVFMLLLSNTGAAFDLYNHEIGASCWAPRSKRRSCRQARHAREPGPGAGGGEAQHPDRVVQFVSQERMTTRLVRSRSRPTPEPTDNFSSRGGTRAPARSLANPKTDEGFMYVMLKLHVDLFAGLPGKLFLGFMGFLLLVAIVSGVVLYSPFMRKLDFGTVRRDRRPPQVAGPAQPARYRTWRGLHGGRDRHDQHLGDLIVKYWQHDQLSALLKPYQGQPTVPAAERGPVQQSMEVALKSAPGMKLSFIAFGGRRSPARTTTPSSCAERALHLAAPAAVHRRCPNRRDPLPAPRLPWYLTGFWCRSPCISATTAACRCRSCGRCSTSPPSSCG
jgi:hypothetical protein